MRNLHTNEPVASAGGVTPHLVAVDPRGQSNRSTAESPNTDRKTTGKIARLSDAAISR